MRILHTIEGMGTRYGGIATCTYELLTAIQGKGHTVEMLTPTLKNPQDKLLGKGEIWMRTFSNDGLGPMNFSWNVRGELKYGCYDLYHVNGMWQHICHATARYARKSGKPYVVTPHGMLYPTALKISYWKKWPMLKFWFAEDIQKASGFHATCETEMNHLRELGYAGPVAVIGNPVNVPEYVAELVENRKRHYVQHPEIRLGFLGRLHPIKRIENLLRGVAQSSVRDLQVVLLGDGDVEYRKFLMEETLRLGINERVEFLGFVSGREKFEQLSRLSALFVPSDMENFGMIVPEALLVGTPVMASLGTPWKSLNDYGCGWWVDNSPQSIAGVIEDIAGKSPLELFTMGIKGREMVLNKFEASIVARKMLQFYSWLLGESDRPNFVYES